VTEGPGEEAIHALRRRLVVGQTLYAFGASLCLANTYWSIGFIVLVQLYFAVAPRLPRGRAQAAAKAGAGGDVE
jgi:hypothetical protein